MFLYKYLKDTWVPLYNSVSFTNLPYSQCKRNREWQDKVNQIINNKTIIIIINTIHFIDFDTDTLYNNFHYTSFRGEQLSQLLMYN